MIPDLRNKKTFRIKHLRTRSQNSEVCQFRCYVFSSQSLIQQCQDISEVNEEYALVIKTPTMKKYFEIATKVYNLLKFICIVFLFGVNHNKYDCQIRQLFMFTKSNYTRGITKRLTVAGLFPRLSAWAVESGQWATQPRRNVAAVATVCPIGRAQESNRRPPTSTERA